jgi:hypothetical protein
MPAQLGFEVGGEHDRGVAMPGRALPERTTGLAPQRVREREDALPHNERRPASARLYRDLERPAAVREHDVDGLRRELATDRAPQPDEGSSPEIRPADERRHVLFDRPVERGAERDDAIDVAERIELAGEFEGDDFGAAPLGPGDEMQDAQRAMLPRRAPAPRRVHGDGYRAQP